MDVNSLKELQKITTPKSFTKGEYICYEGQPGNEMYIILKGLVGVYICSPIGAMTEVSRINEGEFFGEMAIFDSLPRSASCIALEDTVCVAINEENIENLFTCCPKIAKKLVVTMSGRIRHLNKELYKSNKKVRKRKVAKFTIPTAYGFSHIVSEPYQAPKYFQSATHVCPVCKEEVSTVGIKRNILSPRKIGVDGRIQYYECDPLWYEVMACPHCHYSNHYLNFFLVDTEEIETIKQLIKKEHLPVLERVEKKSAFDSLVHSYLQAIHINEHISQDDYELIGTLWLKLYWLGRDSGDQRFAKYCAKNSVKKLRVALDGEHIADDESKNYIALSLAYMLYVLEEKEDALDYCSLVTDCADSRIKDKALRLKIAIEKQ